MMHGHAGWKCILGSLFCWSFLAAAISHAAETVSYQRQVAPVLAKYCAGCHNESDAEADFSVSSFASLSAGFGGEAVLAAGAPADSHLLQLMLREVEPAMPPEDEPAPSAAEIELVRRWIEQGAQDDSSVEPAAMTLASRVSIPALSPASETEHYVGAAAAVGDGLAIGKLSRVEMLNTELNQTVWATPGLAGKVNSIRANQDGSVLVVGSGIAGVGGEIVLLDADSGEVLSCFEGHQDTVYCAALSPDGKVLASGSYDRSVLLWDVATGQVLRELTGHNGAIYDLDFDPTGEVLATASGDQTVKLWNVTSGTRLDTFGQPEGEMTCVRFGPSGDVVFAGGADRQIRMWKLLDRRQPALNPMLVARFAHESDVLAIQLVGTKYLLSASADRTAKLWSVDALKPLGEVAELSDTPVAVCVPESGSVAAWIVELTGDRKSIARNAMRRVAKEANRTVQQTASTEVPPNYTSDSGDLRVVQEAEPNDVFVQAMSVELPAKITGSIEVPDAAVGGEDVDLYRFEAQAGQTWLIEVNAVKDSAVDSRIDVLDEHGQPVLRTRLQAVRESYFTFRGKDSSTSDDFRLHKWEDMELDEYLYSSGEVVRLWLYPRGPDSGFKVYPGFGSRHTFFGTTPISHNLGEPAYVVRELAQGEEPLPNGLPVFPIYFENDDDGLRHAGKDSRLTFVAPTSGVYFLRVRDARSFSGENFGYETVIRPAKPDFTVKLETTELKLPGGSGREFKISASRVDGFEGPISVSLEGVPDGFVATNPLIIEAGQETALGSMFATQQAQPAENDEASPPMRITLTARGVVASQEIVHVLDEHMTVEWSDKPEVQLRLFDPAGGDEELEELTIRPGQTISAKVVIERNGEKSRVGLGGDDAGRNLPHGAYVDNIGLNGLLITEEQSEREFVITAAPKLQPGRRQFHLRSDTKGNPTSRPVWLNVLPANTF